MKKTKKEEEKKNPYHKDYGLFSNIIYIFKNTAKYEKALMIIIPLSAVIAPFMQYLWTFISKFVIDMITGEVPWEKLLTLMAIFTAVQMVSTMINTYCNNQYWRFINVRLNMIREKNMKFMSVRYSDTEDSDVLDCYQKAGQASNGNYGGLEGMIHYISDFLKNLMVVAVGIAIIGSMNIFVTLLMTALAVLTFIFRDHTGKSTKKKVWDPLAKWWRRDSYMDNTSTDFSFAKDIRMFNLSGWLTDKMRELKKERYEAEIKNGKMWAVCNVISDTLWAAARMGLYIWLFYMAVNGELTLGNFSLYLASSETFFHYINNLLGTVSGMLSDSRHVDDWRSFLDYDGGDKDTSGEIVPKFNNYEFTFKNVSFKYPKAEKYALKNLNLTVKAGERLAVVGLNGAGKSTFIKLMLRLYEPDEGEILLNGVNIKNYNKESYYGIFAPVFQDVHLFAFPLSENVSMSPLEKTDGLKAEQCLKDAGLEEKLSELPKGVDTPVLKVIDDNGIDFSGGEKQKLALSRALYKNAPVVILDEPTAALDALAESKLYNNFDKLIGGKTSVYISHRLSSTQFCNNVAMFKDGEMVEYGTHKSLLEKNGAYAEMFRVQAQYYIDSKEESANVN